MQLDFAGVLPLADGRYLARDEAGESVLVMKTLGAPAPARRHRRRPRDTGSVVEPASLPLTRITAIRAYAPSEHEEEVAAWLEETLASVPLGSASLSPFSITSSPRSTRRWANSARARDSR